MPLQSGFEITPAVKILLARTSGFCDGVKRALRIAITAAARPGGLVADGPLVHNRQALDLLALHGVPEAGQGGDGSARVLVRAHGVAPERRRQWEDAGRELVDATCVHVAKNQRLAREAAEKGMTVILAGDPDHAETRAVAGSAGPECRIVSCVADVETLEMPRGDVLFLAQTTFNVEHFGAMAAVAARRFPGCRVVDSICRATHNRQEEARRLAGMADVLVVVGGRHSANTRRLADAGRAEGKPVFLVETAAELREEDFAPFHVAAVTSGASTPGWVTQEVVNRLRCLGRRTPWTWCVDALHVLAESRVSAALSAGGLALAVAYLALGTVVPSLALAGACYVFFAHTLNRRVPADAKARRLSLVDAFYQRRRARFLFLAWVAAAAALMLAAGSGTATLGLFAAAEAAAMVYAMPAARAPAWLAGLRAKPGIRTLIMAAGWGLVLAGPVLFLAADALSGAVAFLFVFLLRLGGTLARDLHDVASDLLLGIETLPVRLGSAAMSRLTGALLQGAAFLPPLLALITLWRKGGVAWPWLFFALALPLAPGLGLLLLRRWRKGTLHDAVLLQAGVDGMGMVAGLVALAALALGRY